MKLLVRLGIVGSYGFFLASLGHHIDSPKFWIGMALFIAYGVVCNLDQ